MKRYWFSILLPVFIVASIGTYYGQGAARGLPEFQFQTVAGDGNEADKLLVEGFVTVGSFGQSVKIGAQRTLYDSRQSMLAYMWEKSGKYSDPQLDLLEKDYKGFMRNKSNYGGFYKDENLLLYAEARQGLEGADHGRYPYSLSISVLDLKTNKEKRFDAILPEKERYSYYYVNDVQLIDGKLKLLVDLSKERYDYRSGGMMSEIHCLTIDLDKERIADDTTVSTGSIDASGSKHRYSLLYTYTGNASPSAYAILIESASTLEQDQFGIAKEDQLDSQLIVYDYKTGKLTPLPETVKGDDDQVYLSNGLLFALKLNGTKLTVQRYDVASGQSSVSCQIPLAVTNADVSKINPFFYGDRLYLYNQAQGENELVVADLKDGLVLYRGKVTVGGTAQEQREQLARLQIYRIRMTA